MITFDFVGSFVKPVDSAVLANPDYSSWKRPQIASRTGTPTATIHGSSVELRSLEIAYGGDVAWENLIGGTEGARLRDRQTTGSITASMPKVAGLDLIGKVADSAEGELSIVHGVGAGNIVKISAPKVALDNASYQEAEGIWTFQSPIRLLPSAGSDDITITAE